MTRYCMDGGGGGGGNWGRSLSELCALPLLKEAIFEIEQLINQYSKRSAHVHWKKRGCLVERRCLID